MGVLKSLLGGKLFPSQRSDELFVAPPLVFVVLAVMERFKSLTSLMLETGFAGGSLQTRVTRSG